MRVTNEMYPRGSVITAQFDNSDSLSYLNGRPMIVMSVLDPFNSVSAICCTTKDRPGIEVSIYDHYSGEFYHGNEFTVACPYRVHEIPIRNIRDWIGVINPITMQAITDAFAWHFGLSQTPPPYMTQMLADEYSPRYNMSTSTNTSMAVTHGMCSLKEAHRSFALLNEGAINAAPPTTYNSTTSVPEEKITMVTNPTSKDIGIAVAKFIQEKIVYADGSTIATCELHKAFEQFSNMSIHINMFSRKFNVLIREAIPKATRGNCIIGDMKKIGYSGIAFVSETPDNDAQQKPEQPNIERRTKIFDALSMADRTDILFHRFRPGGAIDNHTLSIDDIGWLSKRIVDSFGFFRETFTEDLVKGMENQGYHWQFIDTDKVAMLMLYGNWDQIKPSAFAKIRPRFEYLVATEHLDFSDLRKWPNIVNGQELKKMMPAHGGGANLHMHPAAVQAYSNLLQRM